MYDHIGMLTCVTVFAYGHVFGSFSATLVLVFALIHDKKFFQSFESCF